METVAGRPVQRASDSGVLGAGGHVHQLLNLAHALAGNTTTASSKDSAGRSSSGSGNVPVAGSVVMDVASLRDAECLGWAQDVEALLRVGQALAVQVAGELGRRVSAGRFADTGSRGQVGLLVDALQLSASEASRRLKLAGVVLPVVDGISGAVASVAHPVLGEAFLSGAVSQERASMVARYVADADRLAGQGRISEETRCQVEESLVGTARLQGPDFVRRVGNQILSHLDPDGYKPSHAELLAKQGLFFHRPRNGLISFHGAVTILQHEELMAALDLFGNPNKHKNVDTINPENPENPESADASGQVADGGLGEGHGGEDAAGSGGLVSSGVSECEGQSSLLEDLGGLAGLFTSTGEGAMAQPGPDPAPAPESRCSGRSERPDRAGSTAPDDAAEPVAPPGVPDQPGPPTMPESALPPAQWEQLRAPDDPEKPDPPQQPDSPVPGTTAGGTPAGATGAKGGVGWWGRRLEPWEIPARPPEAPEYATPPVYEGQDWFWLPVEPATRGWATPSNNGSNSNNSDDFFNIFQDPPTSNGGAARTSHGGAARTSHGGAARTSHDRDSGSGSGGDGDVFNIFQDGPTRWPVTRDDSFNIWQDHTAPTALTTADLPPTAEDTAGAWGTGWATASDDADASEARDAADARVEHALSGLDSIDPSSTDPAVKDTRTRGQQLLDGLISCVKLASRTGKLPRNGGLKAQLILACSQPELERAFQPGGAGTINTTFNGPMPLRLFDTALCDPEITRIVYGKGQEILNAGRTQRLFTGTQRRILYARDLGCSFPDCTIPATWTEAHHIIPWQEGGESSIENGCLLCGHHHALIHHSDWTVQLINGTPWFTPPWLIDPTQTPRRNTYHHGLTPKQWP